MKDKVASRSRVLLNLMAFAHRVVVLGVPGDRL